MISSTLLRPLFGILKENLHWRQATKADKPGITKLLETHFKETNVPQDEYTKRFNHSLELIDDAIEHPDKSAFLVLEDKEAGATPQGMGLLTSLNKVYKSFYNNIKILVDATGKAGYMGLGFIAPDYRGQYKMADACYQARLAKATELGFDQVYILSSNGKTETLFKRNGFTALDDNHPIMNQLRTVEKRDLTGKKLYQQTIHENVNAKEACFEMTA